MLSDVARGVDNCVVPDLVKNLVNTVQKLGSPIKRYPQGIYLSLSVLKLHSIDSMGRSAKIWLLNSALGVKLSRRE